MKIAIQGHPTRGKEVIQILESLGGKTIFVGLGFDERYYYYINPNSIIIESSPITIKTKDEFKLYTLEDFEKEFPFKVGDIVTFKKKDKYPHTIKSLSIWSDGDIVCEFEDTGLHYSLNKLKYYKEMKEERNITLTLDKAKEWYKKGGELREIALQTFTEQELNPLPKTWEEFCENFPVKKGECFFEPDDEICATSLDGIERTNKDWIPSKKSAEAHLAMIQLEQLRDCWRQGNIPQGFKYKINKTKNEYTVLYGEVDAFLSFCDLQTAEEFLECFEDLIEKAGDLI